MITFEPLNFSPMINLSDGSYTKWREKKKPKKNLAGYKIFIGNNMGTAKHDHYLQKQTVAVL